MSSPASPTCSTQPTRQAIFTQFFHWFIRGLIVCFVVWHLFAILVRNPLDLWSEEFEAWASQHKEEWQRWKPTYQTIDKATKFYDRLVGCEQGWGMFSPPLARAAPFLAAEITFSDGSHAMVPSFTQIDTKGFFRFGGTRLRKLETILYRHTPDELADLEDLPVYSAYVRWCVRRWRTQSPLDPRQPVMVRLLKHRLKFPTPGEDPQNITEGETDIIGSFDLDGILVP